MTELITQGIRVGVETAYEGSFEKQGTLMLAFSYTITIANESKDAVQLLRRHWEILDALNHEEFVDGEGVVGRQPILQPGESHSYKSGCMLHSPHGAMKGYYLMTSLSTGAEFRVEIPLFRLNAPFALN
ncbi:Co2+/Mg2+ efflux protein ApaG [Croceiramulus getboli]|nr:Co2+/Mg2+ efflux protein ApaG [Flavobacteriaceae bacterium YJPT1-3]